MSKQEPPRGELISDSSRASHEMLEQLEPYISSQAREMAYLSKDVILDADDIVQIVLIKLWLVLRENSDCIKYPRAYVKRVIHNLLIDSIRQYRPTLPLSTSKEGEFEHVQVLIAGSKCLIDPEQEYEQKCTVHDLLTVIAEAVKHLPRRQQQALICSLRDRIDDPNQLIEIFNSHGLNVETFDWPADRAELHSLKCSVTLARRAIARIYKDSSEVLVTK